MLVLSTVYNGGAAHFYPYGAVVVVINLYVSVVRKLINKLIALIQKLVGAVGADNRFAVIDLVGGGNVVFTGYNAVVQGDFINKSVYFGNRVLKIDYVFCF